MTDLKPTSLRGLNIAQLCARLGGDKPIDRSTLWRRLQKDPDFPRPYYLWDSAPRFVEAEVDAYIARRIAERDDPVCAAAQHDRMQQRELRISEARAQKTRAVKAATAVKRRRQPRQSQSDP
jgi:predicted DNA-binding transcriptional regulator AlpA